MHRHVFKAVVGEGDLSTKKAAVQLIISVSFLIRSLFTASGGGSRS